MLTVDTALADIEELRTLVQEGHDKGYLTYDEVAATLEEVELSKEQLEDFYTYLLDHNIELLDGESKQQAQQHRLIHGEKPPELDLTVEPSLDSLRLYLREIGKVPLLTADQEVSLRLAVLSFGFKYGIPLDADTVLDLRFLPNPYWNPELRPYTGKDAAVREFVLGQELAGRFVDHAVQMLETAIEGYLSEGRRYVTVAVGCTGGKHRSVATAEELSRRLAHLESAGVQLTTFHRDLGRE